jgi:hypothetical protein
MTKKSKKQDWRRFTTPAFMQRLWEHMADALVSGLDADVRANAQILISSR